MKKETVTCCRYWSVTQYTAKDSLAFLILLPLPSGECWDYKCLLLCLVSIALGTETWAS